MLRAIPSQLERLLSGNLEGDLDEDEDEHELGANPPGTDPASEDRFGATVLLELFSGLGLCKPEEAMKELSEAKGEDAKDSEANDGDNEDHSEAPRAVAPPVSSMKPLRNLMRKMAVMTTKKANFTSLAVRLFAGLPHYEFSPTGLRRLMPELSKGGFSKAQIE